MNTTTGRDTGTRTLCLKLWLTRITVACFFLAGGVEYSIIIPTCWDYMHKKFQASEGLYGLTLAAMGMTNLVVGPIMGAIYDHIRHTKLLVIFINLFEIGGNFMYFAATSKYMILGSRFIVGVGWSAGAILYGELANTTTKEERARMFAVCLSCRQFGFLFGPGLNLLLQHLKTSIGPFTIDVYTSPGLLMAIVWAVVQLLFLFCFFEFPFIDTKATTTSTTIPPPPINAPKSMATTRSRSEFHIADSPDETTPIISSAYLQDSQQSTHDMFASSSNTPSNVSGTPVQWDPLIESPIFVKRPTREEIIRSMEEEIDTDESQSPCKDGYGSVSPRSSSSPSTASTSSSILDNPLERLSVRRIVPFSTLAMKAKRALMWVYEASVILLREEMVVLLSISFFLIFTISALESGLAPIAENIMGWTDFETTLFYSGLAVVNIFGLLAVWGITHFTKIKERYIILFGIVVMLLAITWLLVLLGKGRSTFFGEGPTTTKTWAAVGLSISFGAVVLGLPLSWVAGNTLYSKLVPIQIQGFGQGVRRSMGSLAAIMGPLWVGAALDYSSTTYYLLYGVPISFMLLSTVLIVLSFRRLVDRT